jgi:hypothetical protein
MKGLYTIYTDHGMAICDFNVRNMRLAKAMAITRVGSDHLIGIERTKRADIEWAYAMGARLPEKALKIIGVSHG